MSYEECIREASKRYSSGKLKICPRGYCTAKQKFAVYPSAYANGYAIQVCEGAQPDYEEQTEADEDYMSRLETEPLNTPDENGLQRWFDEQWVNVCEKGNGPGGYKPCGSGQGVQNPAAYPYCRPYYKRPGTTEVTVSELTPEELQEMCQLKRSLPQGVEGKPTRVYLPQASTYSLHSVLAFPTDVHVTPVRPDPADELTIPTDVQVAAQQGLDLLANGFAGGTQTGWDRAKQLAHGGTIDARSLADMRTWFARHGPDAKSGGTSYPGYCQWLADGSPMEGGGKRYRGAVAWLIWGGDAAYRWLKTVEVRDLLRRTFPQRKEASEEDNLGC